MVLIRFFVVYECGSLEDRQKSITELQEKRRITKKVLKIATAEFISAVAFSL